MVAHCGGSTSSSSALGGSGGGAAKPALKKGPWTAAEDAVLMEYVKKNGEGNWNAVQKNTSLARCGKSCRLRWTNHLRPNLKKGSFTPEEEQLILQLHAQLGNKWARMAAQLPGRTDNEIKNYWNTRIKRRIRQGLPLYPNNTAPPQGGHQNHPITSHPMEPQQPVPTRGRPLLQIPTRTMFQAMAHSHSPSPTTLSPVPLSPQQQYSHSFTTSHSLALIGPTTPLSPATSGLPSPHSPISLNLCHDPNAALFPGFSVSSPGAFPTASPFQFNPSSFNFNNSQYSTTSTNLVELPSNQLFLSQVGMTEPEAGIEIKTQQPCMPRSSSDGLLEDLLEQTEALGSNENSLRQSFNNFFNLQDEKFEFSLKPGYGWDVDNYSSGFGIKNEEVKEENGSMHEELSKLLQSISSPVNTPNQFSHQGGDNSSPSPMPPPPSSFSFGGSDMVMTTEDSLGLDMQQIASLFQMEPASVDLSQQGSATCHWDSMPRLC